MGEKGTYFYALSERAKEEPESTRDVVEKLWVPFFHNNEDQVVGRHFDKIMHGCDGRAYQLGR